MGRRSVTLARRRGYGRSGGVSEVGGGAGTPVDPNMYGVNALTATAFYATTSAPYVGVAATGEYSIAVLFRIESQAVGSATRIIAATGTSSGFNLYTTGTNATLTAGVINSSGFTTASYTISPEDVGKIMLAVINYTVVAGSGTLTLTVGAVGGNAVSVGGGGTLTVPTGVNLTVGKRSDGNAATSITIYGIALGSTKPTYAQIQAYKAACVAAADIVPSFPGFTVQNCWSVKRDQVGGAVPATLTDVGGGTARNLTRNGSPSFVTTTGPVWVTGGPYNPEVWLAVGDSIFDGAAPNSGLPVGYPPTNKTLWMVRSNLAMAVLAEPCADSGGSFGVGPAGMFGWLRQQRTGVDVVIVNGGYAGSRSDEWLVGSAHYNAALARVQTALAWEGATFGGFLVSLGANNAIQSLGDFGTDVAAMIASYRADLGSVTTGKPVAFDLLPVAHPAPGTVGDPAPAWDTVRAQQLAYAGTGKLAISMEGITYLSGDSIHPDVNGSYLIAQRMDTDLDAAGF